MKFFVDNTYNLWLFGLVCLSGGALLWPVLQRRGDTISLLQVTQLINQGKAVLVDVREPAEFATGHVRDAKNIPLNQLLQRMGELDKFKSRALIFVCHSGTQSSKATMQLKKTHFSQVYSVHGGLAAWRAQGLPTTK